MLKSEQLRTQLSQEYAINLEKYAWPEELKQKIFQIKLDKEIEETANTLEEVYQQGFNIGHCGLTSRYIAREFETAKLYYGTAALLVGTTASPNGEHAWTVIDGYLIDTTLMICFPIEHKISLGYVTEKEITPQSARILSEYERYENDYKNIKKHIKK